MDKRYFHLLDQFEYESLMIREPSIQFILDNFKQPEWCLMPEAIHPTKGCEDLTDKEIRMDISPRNACKDCPYCRVPKLGLFSV